MTSAHSEPGDGSGHPQLPALAVPGVAANAVASDATAASALRGIDLSRARRTLGALVICHTVNDFYGLVLPPLLPALMGTFHLSYTQAGVLPSVTTALSALLQPTLGYLADRRQLRKLLMATGFVMFAVSMLWIGNAGSYVMLLIAAGFLGLSASTYHPQSATLLSHHFPDRRGWAQGIHGIGNGVGFMLASLVVSHLVTTIGWRPAVTLLALPALAAAIIVGASLDEPKIRGGRGMLAGITRPLLLLVVVNGCAMGVGTGFINWLPSFYNAQGYSLSIAGALTALMLGAAMVAQPIGGVLSDRLGRRNLIIASLAGMAIFQFLFVAASQLAAGWPVLVVMTLLVNFWASLMPPVVMVYASEVAAGERSGMAVGVVWGLGTLVGSASPFLTGIVIDVYGFSTSFLGLATVALATAFFARRLP